MSDHMITVEGGTSVRLPTAGKYCDRDIVVTANGSASEPVVQPLEITENGTYTAADGVNGYSPVTVNVPGSDRNAVRRTYPLTADATGAVPFPAIAGAGESISDLVDAGFSATAYLLDPDTGNVSQMLSLSAPKDYSGDTAVFDYQYLNSAGAIVTQIGGNSYARLSGAGIVSWRVYPSSQYKGYPVLVEVSYIPV